MKKEAAPFWVRIDATAAQDTDGTPVCRATMIDITERKKAEAELVESKALVEAVVENVPLMIFVKEATDLRFVIFNHAGEELLGYDRRDLMGKNNLDLFPPEQAAHFMAKDREVLDGEAVMLDIPEEPIQTAKKGQRLLHTRKVSIRGSDGTTKFLLGISEDITERKKTEDERLKLEAQLRQSQKMESLGTLAGGIAHNFNNILAVIIGNTELAVDNVPESNPAGKYLKEILSASLRAKDVVSQILGFARKTVFQLMPVKMRPIISETLTLIRASVPATIEIRQDLSCTSDTVMADSTQIKQMLINLCDNAKKAMLAQDGVLEVKLENTLLDEKNAGRHENLSPGNYLKLTVRDTGHGIDPKIIDRIIDPYFTTSSMAEASGMGLAVVHGIVKHHNGAITAASEPGKGSVFEVLFPLTENQAEAGIEKTPVLPSGNEKILFIDDDASLVKMAKRMLENHGYQVETKNDPVEALDVVRSEPGRFDLIITDMTMPKMTGDTLAQEILSIRPDMPIILCSGFNKNIDADKARALGIRRYIEKPLNMSDFVAAVRRVLDEAKRDDWAV